MLPLSLPGVFAGSLLTFIPAMGDFVNAELLGNPQTRMIGNVIQSRFLENNDYPTAAALSFILMAGDPGRWWRSTPGSWAPKSSRAPDDDRRAIAATAARPRAGPRRPLRSSTATC